MLAFSCSFCHHVNPPGSKFCNECGSPLRLTPCLQCDAVNEVGSATCHQCGAPLAPTPAVLRPVENRTASFEERLDALRRDFGIPRDPPLGTRRAVPANIAPAPSVPVIALAERGLGTWGKNDSPPPGPAASSTTTTSSSVAPASSSAPDAPLRPAPASSIVPVPPSIPPPASFVTTAANAAADQGQRVASPPGVATVRPAVRAPTEPRTVPPRLLYVVGAGLILVGVAGYMYALYGAPDRIEQWLGALRQAVASQGPAVRVPPQSIPPAVDATAPSSPAPGHAGVTSRTDDAAMTAPGTTAPSSSVPMGETARDVAANSAPAQTAAPTNAESPASASATQTPSATESAPARASDAPPVAAASAKHAPRAKRRGGTRKTPPSHSEIAPRLPMSVPAVDTRWTTALPLPAANPGLPDAAGRA